MDIKEQEVILGKFKLWFKDGLIDSHKKNTLKLSNIDEFAINPFLLHYLANYLEGDSRPVNLAKVLVYPRVLGTSITTSFGTQMQTFITKVLGAYGSHTSGLDIEFHDQVDGRKKYCQLKSGPNSLNRDDVTTVKNHFKALRNLARRNNDLDIQINDLVFCLIYGEPDEKNTFIKELESEYVVYIGQEFWHRFTGDKGFYKALILSIEEVVKDVNMKQVVDNVIDELAMQIENRFKDILK